MTRSQNSIMLLARKTQSSNENHPSLIHEIAQAIQRWNATQAFDVIQQLDNGIRSLDLCIGPTWTLHHGDTTISGKNIRLEDLLNEIADWLLRNDRETILVSLRWGSSQMVPPETFASNLLDIIKGRGSWWLNSTIPTLEQARGKMVLIRRQGSASLIDAGVYFGPGFSIGSEGGGCWHSQDYQNLNEIPEHPHHPQDTGLKAKIRYIKDTVDAATIPDREDRLFVNFTSGHIPDHDSPLKVASIINPEVMKYVSTMKNACLGTVVMDFPNNVDPVSVQKSEEPMFVLVRALIATNKFYSFGYYTST
jgi:1-phosphatidylinositol phosphodiesterase